VLGSAPDALKQFQASAGLDADGDPGPKTRSALHKALLAFGGVSTTAAGIMSAPVVDEKQLIPDTVETRVKKRFNLFAWIGGLILSGGLGALGISGMNWQGIIAIGGTLIVAGLLFLALRHWLIKAIKEVLEGLA
jgi:putative chitinase